MTDNFTTAIASQKILCPVCRSDKFHVIHSAGDYEYQLPGVFYISACDSCGLIFQNPRPPFDEILRYYTEEYEPFKQVGSPLMQKLRRKYLVEPRINKYKHLFPADQTQIKVLDVGCAQGDLLRDLSSDPKFVCEGVEPVKHAADMGVKSGLNIHHTTLEKFECQENLYDLIIMNHVLEHLPNPDEIVSKVYRILKPGGFFCGETPCSSSLERAVFGKYWGMYHLPRHLTYFSKKLITRFLANFGFGNIAVSLQPTPSAWQASVRNYLLAKNYSKSTAKIFSGHSLLLNLISFPYAFITAKLGFSSILHFAARK